MFEEADDDEGELDLLCGVKLTSNPERIKAGRMHEIRRVSTSRKHSCDGAFLLHRYGHMMAAAVSE